MSVTYATRKPMARSSIARLNALARRHERAGMSVADAVAQAATEYGLEAVKEFDESGVLYRTRRNRYVMGWVNAPTLEDGAGFDDQIEEVGWKRPKT